MPSAVRSTQHRLIDAGFQRVFDAPLRVPTRDVARQLLLAVHTEQSGADTAARMTRMVAVARPVMVRLGPKLATTGRVGRRVAKVSGSGRGLLWGVAAITTATSVGASAHRGVRELQVLSSYLVARLDALGLPVERDAVERATLAAYLDAPRAERLLARGATRGQLGRRAARRWAGRALSPETGNRAEQRVEAWLDAIERLDLSALATAPLLPMRER